MKKSVIGIIMAVTLVGSSLAFPVQAYAKDNNSTIEENNGNLDYNNANVGQNNAEITYNTSTGMVTNNNGMVRYNNEGGTVTTNNSSSQGVWTNNGTVGTNNGLVTNNCGTITNNHDNATVKDNYGTVMTNDGTVTTNNGTVTTNYETITTNYGTVESNCGEIEDNYGKVENNETTLNNNYSEVDRVSGDVTFNQGTIGIIENGAWVATNYETITTNDGEVFTNAGTVTTNNGTVTTNNETITTNNGTVSENYATVATNNETIENNFGAVDENYGTIKNNYDGTVNNVGDGKVLHQWFECIINGGSIKSGNETSEAAGKSWFGNAAEENDIYGLFYITVAAADGMIFDYAKFTDGSDATYVPNEDGSFTFGNVSSAISIFFKQLINNNNNNTNTGSNSDANTNNANDDATNLIASIEAIIASEEAMPVTSFVSDEAVAKIPEAAKNSGASYNLSVITSSQGFTAAVNKISETVKAQNAVNNAGQRITSTTIYSEKPMLFTADVLNAISASDIDFVFVFMHNGKMYKVTIPRGAMIDFTGHVYEGPLYFGQILGTTEVIG